MVNATPVTPYPDVGGQGALYDLVNWAMVQSDGLFPLLTLMVFFMISYFWMAERYTAEKGFIGSMLTTLMLGTLFNAAGWLGTGVLITMLLVLVGALAVVWKRS